MGTNKGKDSLPIEQLVLPTQCRNAVLHLAHDIPLAGHLGKGKTSQRVLERFYWPILYRDVANFCKRCGCCQKASRYKGKCAPFVPLPIIDIPFKRIAMNIIGPLPRSRSGNKYILVVCDYATRYPEAMAICSIEAEHIAEELIKLFARVRIPEEILTDQGSNFTLSLLAELYRMLHVHPCNSNRSLPSTDRRPCGTVQSDAKEHAMKVCNQRGKGLGQVTPYLLFAYREVPQASTGFSPFELLYGWSVQGPLDILSNVWEGSPSSNESVVSHILSMRKKLSQMSKLVNKNLTNAQAKQKQWYDNSARSRKFSMGDQVLVLLPTDTNKLIAQWQGPYQVMKKIGNVNYQIDMHDHQKRKRIFHVNMLHPWYSTVSNSCFVRSIGGYRQPPLWQL